MQNYKFKECFFKVQTEYKNYNLYYTEWGNKSDYPILCIHGLTRNCRDFDIIAQQLTDLNYRVICLDIVGRGESDRTDPHLYIYQNYLEDILLFLEDQQIDNLHWLGTSLGGIIAMLVASLRPNLINKLILNDIGFFVPAEPMNKLAKYIGLDPEFNSFDAALAHFKLMLKYFGIKSEQNWQLITQNSIYLDNGAYKLKFDPNIAIEFKNFILKNPQGNDLKSAWDQAKFNECLLLRGANSDILLPQTAAKMLQDSNNVILYEFANIGHTPSLLEPEQIEPILNFLK